MKKIIILIFILFYTGLLFSKGNIIFADSMNGKLIGRYVQYYEDTHGRLTINDILQNNGPKFSQNKKEIIDFGHTNSAYWIKFKIKFKENKKWILALEIPWIGHIDFYKIRKGKIEKYSTGDRKKYSQRQIDNRIFAFQITEPKETQYYFRFKAGDPLSLPLRIVSRKKFDESSRLADKLFGIYFGLLFAMITYNFLLFISTKTIHYFYYSSYLFFFGLFALNLTGLDYVYLYPNYPRWRNDFGFNIYISITAIFLLLFTKIYLEIKKANILKIFNIFLGFFGSIILLTPFVSYYYLMKVVLLVTIAGFIFLSFVSIDAYREGKRSAKFYLAAFSFLILGGVVNILANLGVLPFTTLTNNSAIIASAFEAVVLALGLADVINNLNRDLKEKNRQVEEDNKKIKNLYDQLGLFNKNLEMLVAERTSELMTSLNETSSLLNNMSQAVFSVDSKGDVIGKVSKFSSTIFGQDILGKNIFSFLLKDTGADSIAYCTTSFNLSCLIGADDLQWICLEDRFPRKITRKSDQERDQILKISYAPIVGNDSITASIMYVIEDITKVEALEKEMKNEKEKSQRKIQTLQEIVSNSKNDFRSFIRDSQLLKDNLKKALVKNDMESIYRDVHTMKGNCRVYELTFLSESIHILESELKEDQRDHWPSTIDKIIKNVDSYIETSKEIFGKDVDGSSLLTDVETTTIPMEIYIKVVNKLKTIAAKNNLPDIIDCIDRLEKVDLKSNFKRFGRVIHRLAKNLEKEIDFELEGSDLFLKQEQCTLINESFIHIIQNSADHGIEKKGIIKIELNQSKNNKIITISDNGKGLDPKKILSIALNKGIINYEDSEGLNDKESIMLIFKPGFSTKEMASEYSGRGVGMDVVKTNIEKMGGTIDLQSTLGEGTSFIIKIPHGIPS